MSTETTVPPTLLKLSDQQWGYRFGCEGLLKAVNAAKLLDKSTDTLDRLAEKGLLRKGKYPGTQTVAYCKKSVMDYIASVEL